MSFLFHKHMINIAQLGKDCAVQSDLVTLVQTVQVYYDHSLQCSIQN